WDCTTKTSAPRTDSSARKYISPEANRRTSPWLTGLPRLSAISWASVGWMVPEYSIIRFFVMISTRLVPLGVLRSVFGVLALAVALDDALLGPFDRERTRRHILADHRARPR